MCYSYVALCENYQHHRNANNFCHSGCCHQIVFSALCTSCFNILTVNQRLQSAMSNIYCIYGI